MTAFSKGLKRQNEQQSSTSLDRILLNEISAEAHPSVLISKGPDYKEELRVS